MREFRTIDSFGQAGGGLLSVMAMLHKAALPALVMNRFEL
jgi:hypothetical protein